MIVYVKTGLDLLIKLMNFFPGWKTKVGAVLQVIVTIMMAIAGFDLYAIPNEVILTVKATADVLVAAGAANLIGNNKAS